MSLRLKCPACQTTFLTADENLGRTVSCPKCGAPQTAPPRVPAGEVAAAPLAAESASAAAGSAWVPADDEKEEAPRPPPRGRRRLIALVVVGVVTVAGVASLVAWPILHPRPTDPAEVAAEAYLKALVANDLPKARLLGTVDEPPAIRSYETPHRKTLRRDQRVRGSFAPIARMHEQIDKKFTFDPDIGRFQVKNPLGPAAETLDALHDARTKAKEEKIYEKIASGDPEELFDSAEALGTVFTKLAEGALAPQKLLPTYAKLVKEARPPLPPEAAELARAYGDDPATWNALLKRRFHTLKADGPFILDRVDVTAQVRDRLASSGDPPTTMRLTLTRFRLDRMDTGWKVTAARREPAPSDPGAQSTGSSYRTRPERISPGDEGR